MIKDDMHLGNFKKPPTDGGVHPTLGAVSYFSDDDC